MRYLIDGKENFFDIDDVAEYITNNLSDDYYDEMLDECYGEVEIAGLSYATSIALYRTDEIAYRCGKNDYYSSLAEDIVYEIERMDDGDISEIYGFEVEAFEEEEEE